MFAGLSARFLGKWNAEWFTISEHFVFFAEMFSFKKLFFSKMYEYVQGVDSMSALRAKQLNDAGRTLFYHITSSITSLEMIFPASAESFGFVLKKLGEVRAQI